MEGGIVYGLFTPETKHSNGVIYKDITAALESISQ